MNPFDVSYLLCMCVHATGPRN